MNTEEQMKIQTNDIMPKSNMTLAVISTIIGAYSFLFLGFFLGLVAVGFAKKSQYKGLNGDYAGAVSASNRVKKLSYLIFTLVFITVIYTVYVVNQEGGVNAIIEKLKEQRAVSV